MIYIIRHGQTELNSRKLLQGRSDHPLNDTGRQQAAQAGERLRNEGIVFSRVYSSPLLRAVQTAEIVAPGTEILTDERLLEMDYGPYEGTDLSHPPQEVITFFRDFIHNPAPAGMQTPGDQHLPRASPFPGQTVCLPTRSPVPRDPPSPELAPPETEVGPEV